MKTKLKALIIGIVLTSIVLGTYQSLIYQCGTLPVFMDTPRNPTFWKCLEIWENQSEFSDDSSPKQIFESKKMELMTPEIDPQYCKELEEKNRTVGKWDSDQERNDVRQTLDKCQREKESIERLDEIIFENCEQFKEEYDGKIFQKIPDEKGVELTKYILNDCKMRK